MTQVYRVLKALASRQGKILSQENADAIIKLIDSSDLLEDDDIGLNQIVKLIDHLQKSRPESNSPQIQEKKKVAYESVVNSMCNLRVSGLGSSAYNENVSRCGALNNNFQQKHHEIKSNSSIDLEKIKALLTEKARLQKVLNQTKMIDISQPSSIRSAYMKQMAENRMYEVERDLQEIQTSRSQTEKSTCKSDKIIQAEVLQ